MSVSVILTVRGDDRLLEGAALTVCQQHFRPIELIIVDDGIEWNTTSRQQLACLCDSHDLLLKFVESDAAGRAAALNTGLRNCGFDFVAILDADDRWHPLKLSRQLAQMDVASNVILGTDIVTVFEQQPGAEFDFSGVDVGNEHVSDVTAEVMRHCPLTHSSIVAPRRLVEAIHGYDQSRKSQLDWDLFARAAMYGAVLRRRDAPLTMKRLHENQSFEARGKFGYLARSVSLQWRIQKQMGAPRWYRFFILRRALIWLLPRPVKWWLQSRREGSESTRVDRRC